MSSPIVSEQCLQKHEEDIEVEDTVVSPLVSGNREEPCAFDKLPYEIVMIIMEMLGPASQTCFSITGPRFRKVLKDSRDFEGYLHGPCHAPRLSLELSLQESICGYVWDKDDYYLDEVPTFDDKRIQWFPCLGDLLQNEPLALGSDGHWCKGCCRILPSKSWDQCNFEKKLFGCIANPEEGRLQPHELVTSLLVDAFVEGLERGGGIASPHLRLELLSADKSTSYESQEYDFDYDLCTKCRLKEIITDSGRRPEVWQGSGHFFKATGREADAVAIAIAIDGGVGVDGGDEVGRDRYTVQYPDVYDPDTWKKSVLWKDVWRACGLFVKEYKMLELPLRIKGEAVNETRIDSQVPANNYW